MRVSLVGMLNNAADALDAFDRHLGGDDAEGENADTIYEHQPRMLAYCLREAATNADKAHDKPDVLDEFMRLYCLKAPLADSSATADVKQDPT